MGLYQQPGYNRLAFGVTALAFVGSWLFFWITEGVGAKLEVLVIFMPFASMLFAVAVYLLFRLVYWIIDGFKSHK